MVAAGTAATRGKGVLINNLSSSSSDLDDDDDQEEDLGVSSSSLESDESEWEPEPDGDELDDDDDDADDRRDADKKPADGDEEDEERFCDKVIGLLQRGRDLNILKLEQCKAYLRRHNLRLSGTKSTCVQRIQEHWRIKDGNGEKAYPRSSFVINCTGDVCTGDVILFKQKVYKKYDLVTRGADIIGKRTIAGRVVTESYGEAKQQHTFTVEVLWSKGIKALPALYPLLVKGRNLYKLKTFRQRWDNEAERSKVLVEKHKRGAAARYARAIANARAANKGSKRQRHSSDTRGPLKKPWREESNPKTELQKQKYCLWKNQSNLHPPMNVKRPPKSLNKHSGVAVSRNTWHLQYPAHQHMTFNSNYHPETEFSGRGNIPPHHAYRGISYFAGHEGHSTSNLIGATGNIAPLQAYRGISYFDRHEAHSTSNVIGARGNIPPHQAYRGISNIPIHETHSISNVFDVRGNRPPHQAFGGISYFHRY